MKTIFLPIIVILMTVTAWAGNVRNYTPDVPLVNTPEGLTAKVADLCNKSTEDLTWYFENNLEYQKMLSEYRSTRSMIKINQQLAPGEKASLLTDLKDCRQTLSTRIQEITKLQNQEIIKTQIQANSRNNRLDEQKQINDLITTGDVTANLIRFFAREGAFIEFKVDVTNGSSFGGKIAVFINALDSSDHVFDQIQISGFVDKNFTATLSGRSHIDQEIYQKITSWKVAKASMVSRPN